MGAIKLDGNAIAKGIRERLGQEILDKQKLNPRFKPSLKIIQGSYYIFQRLLDALIANITSLAVGDRSDSCS